MSFVNMIVKHLSLNLCKEKYTRSRKNLLAIQWYQMFTCQLHGMETKILQQRKMHLSQFSALVTSRAKKNCNQLCQVN